MHRPFIKSGQNLLITTFSPKLGKSGASYKTGRMFEEYDMHKQWHQVFTTPKKSS